MTKESISVAMRVRPVVAADYENWLPLWHAYNAFYGRSGPTALPINITKLTWSRLLDPAEPMFALVAEQDGRLVGMTHALLHRSTTLETYTCYLQDLYTVPELRGKGIGRALIEAVYTLAKSKGCERVYWQTHETNETAMKLYDSIAEKTGFVIYRKVL